MYSGIDNGKVSGRLLPVFAEKVRNNLKIQHFADIIVGARRADSMPSYMVPSDLISPTRVRCGRHGRSPKFYSFPLAFPHSLA